MFLFANLLYVLEVHLKLLQKVSDKFQVLLKMKSGEVISLLSNEKTF